MKLTPEQEKAIIENPHIQSGKLAQLLGLKPDTVKSFRYRSNIKKWTYSGSGFPFMVFYNSFLVRYKSCHIYSTPILEDAVKAVDYLISCIESGKFNQPRIEHPYFEKLSLIKE